MRNWLVPALAVVAFGVLLILVVVVPSPSPEIPIAGDDKSAPVLDLSLPEVARLTIDVGEERLVIGPAESPSGDGEVVWELLEPTRVPADQTRARTLIRGISQLYPVRIVQESPGDLEQFGLLEPWGSVVLDTVDGGSHTLFIGDPSPVSEGEQKLHYARLESGEAVFLLGASLMSTLRWGFHDLRLKVVFTASSDPGTVVIRQGDQSLKITRAAPDPGRIPTQWMLVKPYYVPASEMRVQDLLGAIRGLKVDDLVDDRPDDLQLYGLDHPVMEIEMVPQSLSTEKGEILLVGRAADPQGDTVYVMKEGEPFVYTMRTGDLASLPLDPLALARTRLLEPVTHQVILALSFTSSDTQIEIERTNREPLMSRSEWQVSGQDELELSDGEQVAGILNLLRDLRAVSIVALTAGGDIHDYRLESPEIEIRATVFDRALGVGADDPRDVLETSLAIGASLEAADEYRYVVLDDFPAAYLVPAADILAIREAMLQVLEH